MTPGDPQGAPLTTTSVIVRRSGLGRVTSDVRGIDCGQECQEGFSSPVVLTAIPDAGFSFAGWGGACSGRGPCTVAPSAAPVLVTAVFEKERPLPEGCDVLLPHALPAPVVVPLDEPALDGTSDATGMHFLFTTAPAGPASLSVAYHFVRIAGGAATETAVRRVDVVNAPSAYVVPLSAESALDGFDVFLVEGVGHTVVESYAPEGVLRDTQTVSSAQRDGEGAVVHCIVAPGGDVVTVTETPVSDGSGAFRYRRFAARDSALVADVPIALPIERYLATWAVDATGDVLLLAADGGPYGTAAASARWLDPSGAPLTPWFDVGEQYLRYASWIATPDGLALLGDPVLAFRDGEAHASAAAGWIGERALLDLPARRSLQLVRGGRAYAGWGGDPLADVPFGPCGEGVEVLTSGGESCGCVAFPDLLLGGGRITRIGRDGSVIALQPDPGATHHDFVVYSGVFR